MDQDQNEEFVSALICTRNRGSSIVVAITSIFANDYSNFELIVVDQSDNDETESAVAPFKDDPRMRYLRVNTKGVAIARNTGLAEAKSDIVIGTDDDCEVPVHWLRTMTRVFQQNKRVAIAFCNVAAAPHDPKKGFIPAYERTGNQLLTRIGDKRAARGIGAGMSLRRSAILNIGGFDEMLGPGGVLLSCEDGDMAVRALLLGWQVYECSDVTVLHYGYRSHTQGRDDSRKAWIGIGAAYSKPVRCGYIKFAVVPAYEFFGLAVWPPIYDVLRLRRPRGVTRIPSFIYGFSKGWVTPIDRTTLKFVPEN